jgi:peptidoglycan/xylan/chitin deacetylase (PgdA/CDA1 family)
MSKPKTVLLSFDVEEFDIPVEFGQPVDPQTQMHVGRVGFERVLKLLDEEQTPATLFTTANFADHHPDLMRQAAQTHEIGSHAYYHSTYNDKDLEASRLKLQEIAGVPVEGFRRPRLAETDRALIQAAGYTYNSSENPIWLPGRYNNLGKPRRPYFTDRLLNIPISATPIVRFPLFWLSFKVVPLPLLKAAMAWTLAHDKVLNLFFHPWEFTDLKPYPSIPGYIRRLDDQAMLDRLREVIRWLKPRAQFKHFREFAKSQQRG